MACASTQRHQLSGLLLPRLLWYQAGKFFTTRAGCKCCCNQATLCCRFSAHSTQVSCCACCGDERPVVIRRSHVALSECPQPEQCTACVHCSDHLLVLQPVLAPYSSRARQAGQHSNESAEVCTLPASALPRATCSSTHCCCCAFSRARRSPKPLRTLKHCAQSSGLRTPSHTKQPCCSAPKAPMAPTTPDAQGRLAFPQHGTAQGAVLLGIRTQVMQALARHVAPVPLLAHLGKWIRPRKQASVTPLQHTSAYPSYSKLCFAVLLRARAKTLGCRAHCSALSCTCALDVDEPHKCPSLFTNTVNCSATRIRELMWRMRLAASTAGRSLHAWQHPCASCLSRRLQLPLLSGPQAWRTGESGSAAWRSGERSFCLQAQRHVLQQSWLTHKADGGLAWPWQDRGGCSRPSRHVAWSTKAPRPTVEDLVKRIGRGAAYPHCFRSLSLSCVRLPTYLWCQAPA